MDIFCIKQPESIRKEEKGKQGFYEAFMFALDKSRGFKYNV